MVANNNRPAWLFSCHRIYTRKCEAGSFHVMLLSNNKWLGHAKPYLTGHTDTCQTLPYWSCWDMPNPISLFILRHDKSYLTHAYFQSELQGIFFLFIQFHIYGHLDQKTGWIQLFCMRSSCVVHFSFSHFFSRAKFPFWSPNREDKFAGCILESDGCSGTRWVQMGLYSLRTLSEGLLRSVMLYNGISGYHLFIPLPPLIIVLPLDEHYSRRAAQTIWKLSVGKHENFCFPTLK